ncbi:MAG: hypothetical protein QM714_16695 [Nocardioides sp.]|uniref:hypothetical protein n=1 Tax=Nocardioides sp. TaxID=35761 RepID=UPI0039E4547B
MGDTETGKRAGARRAARPPRRFRVGVAGQAVASGLAVLAWGVLVWFAIDFGRRARTGEPRAWWFMAALAVGAIACLCVALMLLLRLARATGIVGERPGHTRSHAASKHAD